MASETKIGDGGPAFPAHKKDGVYPKPHSGMTLRDYFAGQALVGLAAAIQGPGCASWDYYGGAAYHIADAMLVARALSAPEKAGEVET